MFLLVMWDTLASPLTCENFGQTGVQYREGNVHHLPRNLIWYHVKTNELNSPLKDALKEEGCSWFIKFPGHVSLSMRDTLIRPLTCDNFGQTRVQHQEGKAYHHLMNLLWYHVKVYGPYSLSKDALKEEGTSCLIKCSGHVSLGDVRHFNKSTLNGLFIFIGKIANQNLLYIFSLMSFKKYHTSDYLLLHYII
jgi:hypothetical protein